MSLDAAVQLLHYLAVSLARLFRRVFRTAEMSDAKTPPGRGEDDLYASFELGR